VSRQTGQQTTQANEAAYQNWVSQHFTFADETLHVIPLHKEFSRIVQQAIRNGCESQLVIPVSFLIAKRV